jgi:hypothetical protein|nr:hypothetical protein [uncultured Psychroserpens sp.]
MINNRREDTKTIPQYLINAKRPAYNVFAGLNGFYIENEFQYRVLIDE